MTPTQIEQAAPLLDELKQWEDAKKLLENSETEMKYAHATFGTKSDTITHRLRIDRATLLSIIDKDIATRRQPLKQMGVVFEPADAVMPEIRVDGALQAKRRFYDVDELQQPQQLYQFDDDLPPLTMQQIRNILRQRFTQPDHLTITLTGPQGCEKTAFVNHMKWWLSKKAAKVNNLDSWPYADAPDKISGNITIIDGSEA